MVSRLDRLREEFDRLTKAAEEHGYSEFQAKLDQIARDIKQEEIAQRFVNGLHWERDDEKSIQKMV